ncbi:MAG: ribonuclease HII [Clostridia bacterium]|nr:ribonuclease HII [Clostridia bacterium]
MLEFVIENEERANGCGVICGVDEAGRGCLCGRVYAGAVILPSDYKNPELNDSKKLSEKKREKLFSQIVSDALYYGIGFAEVEEIEQINILNASMLAMRRAVEVLGVPVDIALIDGNTARGFDCKTRTVVKGDSISPSIAAASVLAKVSRDRYICALADKYPQYGFEKHKGYCTKAHTEALRRYGPCEIHRMSFLKKIL